MPAPSISQQFIDKMKPKPYFFSPPPATVQQPVELHSTTRPSHFLHCVKCHRHRGSETRRAALLAAKAAGQTSAALESSWEIGLRSRSQLACRAPGSVALLLPGRTAPVSPTREVSPPISEASYTHVPLNATTPAPTLFPKPIIYCPAPVVNDSDSEDLLRNRFSLKRSLAEYCGENICQEHEGKVAESVGAHGGDSPDPEDKLRRPKINRLVRRALPFPLEFSSKRIFAPAIEQAGHREAAKEREQQDRLLQQRQQRKHQPADLRVSTHVPSITVGPVNTGFSTSINCSTQTHTPAVSKPASSMTWWDGAKGFAGWVAGSIYILAGGNQPHGFENSADQTGSSEQGRQSPKRRRTDDHITGQSRWQPGPIGLGSHMVHDDPMDIDTPSSEPVQSAHAGFLATPGSPPQVLFRHSISTLGIRSSTAATTAMHAMRTSMYSSRGSVTHDRRTQSGLRNSLAGSSTPCLAPQRQQDTEVARIPLQTSPANGHGNWVSSPTAHATTHATGQRGTRAKVHGRPGGWTGSPQPQNSQWCTYRRSATTETSVSSSSLAMGDPDKGSSDDEAQIFGEIPRCDPPASYKRRTDYFSDDAAHCLPGLKNLSLTPDDKKLEQLNQEKRERDRLVEEARRAAERAKWDTHLQSLGLRSPKQTMITDLNKGWNEKVNNLLVESKVTCAGPEAVTMTPRDFAKLVPAHVWLNDSAVQAALTELATAINKAAGVVLKQNTPKCAALGPFFWSNLVDSGPKNKERMLKRTWGITPQNFLDIETLLMPINSNNHWTFMLIRPKRRELAYVDSMGGSGHQRIEIALEFIEVFLGPDRWNAEEWAPIKLKIPRQSNGYDCGVFVITNAMYLALGLDPMAYSQSDMPLQRRRIAAALLNGGFKGEFDLMGL